jgi:hypothetical protein
MKPLDEFLKLLYAIDLGPERRADCIRELLHRLLLLSNQPEQRGCVVVTVPIKELATIRGMRRYSMRSVRSWRKWAVDQGVLRVHIVQDGEQCGNSYFVDLSRVRSLLPRISREAV